MAGFGWSVGDLALAIKFVCETGKALKEVGGAANDYQRTIDLLQGVEATLRDLDLFTCSFPGHAYLDSINREAGVVKTHLSAFTDRVRKFETSLGIQRKKGWYRNVVKKTKWAHHVAEQSSELGQALQLPLTAINAHLGMQTVNFLMLCRNEIPQEVTERVFHLLQDTLRTQLAPRLDRLDARSDLQHAEIMLSQLSLNDQVAVLPRSVHDLGRGIQDLQQKSQLYAEGSALAQQHLVNEVLDFKKRLQIVQASIKSSSNRLEDMQRSVTDISCRSALTMADTVTKWQKLREHVAKCVLLLAITIRWTSLQLMSLLAPFLLLLLKKIAVSGSNVSHMLTGGDLVYFEDALGRESRLPYQFFQHWEVLESFLSKSFNDSPGYERVLGGRYHLMLKSGEEVDSLTWNARVRPGSKLLMSIVEESVLGRHTCFRCLDTMVISRRPPGALCTHCGLFSPIGRKQFLYTVRRIGPIDPTDGTLSRELSPPSSLPKITRETLKQRQRLDYESIGLFKRIQTVQSAGKLNADAEEFGRDLTLFQREINQFVHRHPEDRIMDLGLRHLDVQIKTCIEHLDDIVRREIMLFMARGFIDERRDRLRTLVLSLRHDLFDLSQESLLEGLAQYRLALDVGTWHFFSPYTTSPSGEASALNEEASAIFNELIRSSQFVEAPVLCEETLPLKLEVSKRSEKDVRLYSQASKLQYEASVHHVEALKLQNEAQELEVRAQQELEVEALTLELEALTLELGALEVKECRMRLKLDLQRFSTA